MPERPQNQSTPDVAEVMGEIRRRARELPAAEPAGIAAEAPSTGEFAPLHESLNQANRAFETFQQRHEIVKTGYALDPAAWNQLRQQLSAKFGADFLPPPGSGFKFQLKRVVARCMRFFFGAQESYNQQMRAWLDELFLLNAGLLGALNSLTMLSRQQGAGLIQSQSGLRQLRTELAQLHSGSRQMAAELAVLQRRLTDLDALSQAADRLSQETAAHTGHLAELNQRLQDLLGTTTQIENEALALSRSSDAALEQIRQSVVRPDELSSSPAIEREARLRHLLHEGREVEDFNFLDWETQTRGDEERIKQQQAHYATLFIGRQDVLDLGCGRGEFLELLRERGIRGRGVDLDLAMVQHCRQKGLAVEPGNALEYLAAVPGATLGGVFAAQVVEHLTVSELSLLCRQAFRALQPGAPILLETQNPMCLTIFSGAFFTDPTHVKPIHPETLRFFLEQAGFRFSGVHFSAPVPEAEKLALLEPPADPQLARLAERLNENLTKLNSVLYSHAHYAALAHKPE